MVFNLPVIFYGFDNDWNVTDEISGNLFIPCYTVKPDETGYYVNLTDYLGLITPYYEELLAKCSDLTTIGYCGEGNYLIDGNNTFKKYFPSYFGHITNTKYAIKSKLTNLVFCPSRSNRVYNNIDDCINNVNHIFTIDFSFYLTGRLFIAEYWNGSTPSKGTLIHLSTDSNFDNIVIFGFYGTSNDSTRIQIKIIHYNNSTTRNNLLNWLTGGEVPNIVSTDPYSNGGDTGGDRTGGIGGTGDFDGTSDPVDFPNLPNLSAVDTGFITLFNPSASQLKALANYMWSGLFDLDTFKKIFADPMDCILGLSIVPVNVPSGSSDTVKVGNISTGVSMTKATSQYVSVDCGTLNVNEFWGAYLDYSPYTKAEIYLPYVGTHPLDIDDIMNKPVHVKYHIDILSGACIAFVKCGDSVLYSFIGQCSSSIPITGNDWTNVINGVINIAGAVGSMVMTGGMSAPMAIGQIASTAVNSSKPSVEKSGSLSGTGGMLGVQTPYMILTRPQQALPAQQNAYTGYPSFITRTLSSVSGYTEVDHIHLENVPGTESELSEIETLLKTGVIF